MKSPFIIYADFESILVPEDNGKQNPKESYTNKYQKHIACGILIIDKFAIILRGWIKTVSTLYKAFGSYKPCSVSKWIHFIQLFCFLSNIINCQEQLKIMQQT